MNESADSIKFAKTRNSHAENSNRKISRSNRAHFRGKYDDFKRVLCHFGVHASPATKPRIAKGVVLGGSARGGGGWQGGGVRALKANLYRPRYRVTSSRSTLSIQQQRTSRVAFA